MADIPGAILKLIEDPDSMHPTELGLIAQVLAATQPRYVLDECDGGSMLSTGVAALTGGTRAQDPARTVAATLHVLSKFEEWGEELKEGVGRGYSEWPRAPDRTFTRLDRVGEYYGHGERFMDEFALNPDEFDELFARLAPALGALPRRRASLRNRLAMALYYARHGHSQRKVGEWFGCGHSCANDDIDDVMRVIHNDAATAAEISWPTQAEADSAVIQLAKKSPNLTGCLVAGDGKKRAANHPGRTYDGDLHKIDYEGHKGHGRQHFLACDIITGRMVYLDSNFGGRHESYNYHEYDICTQTNRVYWCVACEK